MYYNHKFKISEDELFLQYKVVASDDTLEVKLENVPTEFYKFVDQSINEYLNKKPNIDDHAVGEIVVAMVPNVRRSATGSNDNLFHNRSAKR